MLLGISSAVLVIGIAIFLGVLFTRGTSQPASSSDISKISSQRPTDTNPIQNGTKAAAQVKPPTTALGVARTFLETAVLRKNLDASYGIVGPALKGGFSRAQWHTGNIPVTYYPASNAKTAPFKVKSSTKNALLLEVGLKVAPGTKIATAAKALGFLLEVDRIHGKWLVNYFLSDYRPGVPSAPH